MMHIRTAVLSSLALCSVLCFHNILESRNISSTLRHAQAPQPGCRGLEQKWHVHIRLVSTEHQ